MFVSAPFEWGAVRLDDGYQIIKLKVKLRKHTCQMHRTYSLDA